MSWHVTFDKATKTFGITNGMGKDARTVSLLQGLTSDEMIDYCIERKDRFAHDAVFFLYAIGFIRTEQKNRFKYGHKLN